MPTGRKKRRLFLLPVLLLPLGPSLEKRACAQAPEDGSANSAVMVRPCAVRPTGAKPYRKNKTKGKAAANPSEIPLACVEARSEEHTSELQSLTNLVCRLLLEKKKKTNEHDPTTD